MKEKSCGPPYAAADSVSNDSGVSAHATPSPRVTTPWISRQLARFPVHPPSLAVSTVEELLKENASFHGIGT
jgi:hypothetical protein